MNHPISIRSHTIVVTTYNKPAILAASLDHLLACEIPADLDVEVVVVDNASSDDTPAVIDAFVRKFPARAEHLCETRRGNGHARNAGIARARGEIITVLDHDVIVGRDFIRLVRHEFERLGSRGVIGGRLEPWDRTRQAHFFLTRPDEQVYGPLDQPAGFIHGGNLSFHRDVIARIGGYDERFGAGTSLPASDTDFAYRAWRAGCELRYSPAIVAFHNHGRHDGAELFATYRSYWIANGAFLMKHILRGDRAMLRRAYWDTLDNWRLLRDRTAPPWNRRKLWYYALGALRYLRVARRPERSAPPGGEPPVAGP